MSNLLAATRDLMAVPSPSRGEGALADVVEEALRACPWLDTERVGDNVIGRTTLGHGQRLVLAGHLDEAELVELTMLIAHYLMLATVLRSLRVQLEPAAQRRAAEIPGGPPG